jgi:hypothetical protein
MQAQKLALKPYLGGDRDNDKEIGWEEQGLSIALVR